MVTVEDLKVVSTDSFYEGHRRDVVAFADKHYIVGSVACPVDTQDEDALFNWISSQGPSGIGVLLGFSPVSETWVMEAKWDAEDGEWIPKNECGPQCSTGVCNKRLATNAEVGSQELGYSMLVAHLNA